MKIKGMKYIDVDVNTLVDPKTEKESNIYKILDEPDEYYEDREFSRKEDLNRWVREERKKKTKALEKHRAKQTRHYPELGRMRRAVGMVDKIHISMFQDDSKCRELAHQLMSASTILRKSAFFILQRHAENCLLKKNFKGTNEQRIIEMKYTHDLILKLRLQLEAITKVKTWEEEKFDASIKKIVREIGR